MAEFQYWLDRELGLCSMVEQLDTPPVLRILTLLSMAKSAIGHGFYYFAEDLREVYLEAQENNEFLSTILRYFKVGQNQYHCADSVVKVSIVG